MGKKKNKSFQKSPSDPYPLDLFSLAFIIIIIIEKKKTKKKTKNENTRPPKLKQKNSSRTISSQNNPTRRDGRANKRESEKSRDDV